MSDSSCRSGEIRPAPGDSLRVKDFCRWVGGGLNEESFWNGSGRGLNVDCCCLSESLIVMSDDSAEFARRCSFRVSSFAGWRGGTFLDFGKPGTFTDEYTSRVNGGLAADGCDTLLRGEYRDSYVPKVSMLVPRFACRGGVGGEEGVFLL